MDLNQLARKYIRWQPPEVSSNEPRRVIAQVMNLGTWVTATASVSAKTLAKVR